MRREPLNNLRRLSVPGISLSLSLLTVLGTFACCNAQGAGSPTQPTAPAGGPGQTTPPAGQPPAKSAPPGPNRPPTGGAPAPSSVKQPGGAAPPAVPRLEIETENVQIDFSGNFSSTGSVSVRFGNTVVTSDRVRGPPGPRNHLQRQRQDRLAGRDFLCRFHPRLSGSRSFRLINPRGVLLPEFLREQITEPLYVSGGEATGTLTGYFFAQQFIATTCREHFHHYEFRIGDAELYPHEKLVLHRVSVFFFGVKVITLPYIIIPLNVNLRLKRPRTDYLPEFGQNDIEGYYARFPYSFPEGQAAATFVRLDITQKKAEGYRFEQEYLAGKQTSAFNTSFAGPQGGGFTGATSGTIANAYGYGTTGKLPNFGTGLGPQNGGLFTMQGYFGEGFSRDFNGSFRHQQGIGGNNRFAFSTELQNNSSLIGSSQSNQTSRFNFDHVDPAHGVNTAITLGLNTTSSTFSGSKFDSSQFTGGYHQSFDFGINGANRNTLTYSFDLSRTTSDTDNAGVATDNRSARLYLQFQFQHTSRDYSLTLLANKTTPIGVQTDNSAFGQWRSCRS